MKLKIKTTPPIEKATKVANLVPSPISGVIPPPEHRFKPGPEWKGNAGGRPKLIGQTLEQRLREEVPDPEDSTKKVMRLDLVVKNLIQNAMLSEPHAVSAFREIRATVEPPDQERSERDNWNLARQVLILMMERGKQMEAIDI